MNCSKCQRPMTMLFTSYACDYCDGLGESTDGWDRGYVVWRDRRLPAEEYVFPTPEDADRWRTAQGIATAPIRPVIAPVKFRWRESTGTLRDVTTADHLVTIHSDHRFPPAPNHACLAPDAELHTAGPPLR